MIGFIVSYNFQEIQMVLLYDLTNKNISEFVTILEVNDRDLYEYTKFEMDTLIKTFVINLIFNQNVYIRNLPEKIQKV